MRAFAKGLLAGAAIVAAISWGVARAQQEPPSGASCQVRVGRGQFQGGYQCNFNKVMVGELNGQILCADVTVSCP